MDKSYGIQDGCHNCKHVFYANYDYYCCYRASKRPKSGDIYLGESFGIDQNGQYSDKLFNKNNRKWDRWSDGRKVNESGICDKFKKKVGRV